MRIRTIKPEFFTHPVLSKLTETAKNLAIGLLCYADDEGYFLADPVLVRSAIRPFDDNSRSTHGALTELSSCGFISVVEHPTHGKIGLVVNFTKHQVINRATASKLASYYTSNTTHGELTEDSVSEGKGGEQGMEGNGKHLWEPSELQRRINSWFNRRDSTPWSDKELKAYKAIKDTPPEDLDALEKRYTSNAPYLRQDIATLLNNWPGEIDRANNPNAGKSQANVKKAKDPTYDTMF